MNDGIRQKLVTLYAPENNDRNSHKKGDIKQ